MIKRTMYFYDKAQMRVINNLNNKLHKQRGVNVFDADIDIDKVRKAFIHANQTLNKAIEYLQYADIDDTNKSNERLKTAFLYADSANKTLPAYLNVLKKMIK